MIVLNRVSLNDEDAWKKLNVKLPEYNVQEVEQETKANPGWVHFGAGNIFRVFVAAIQQNLLNNKEVNTGIIAADTFDYDIIDKIYTPFDNLTMSVTLNADGTTKKEIIASVTQSLRANAHDEHFSILKDIFAKKSLQILSFTITEKGYMLHTADGEYLPIVIKDIENGPSLPSHAISITTALLLHRFNAGKLPLAVVSMDNCSHNGDRLKTSVVTLAKEWLKKGFVSESFIAYLQDESYITFPWSMIDKIVPRPDKVVQDMLEKDNITGMSPIVTSRNTYIAPFVNAEAPQYLVIEDKFPAGRPPLEKAGVFLASRDIVNCTERMKVTTCLNPLHTAMSVFGCLLGYNLICEEMKDEDILNFIKTLGYKEGLPVVDDPKIINPKAFIDEVIEKRLPNPFMPDSPQRIVTDTSQKVGIRFGETIKSYIKNGKDVAQLQAVPLAIAGWLRYLLGVDDKGQKYELAQDPLNKYLTDLLKGIEVGNLASYNSQLLPILSNETIFNVDLVKIGMANKIETLFVKMLDGDGAVRKTLKNSIDK